MPTTWKSISSVCITVGNEPFGHLGICLYKLIFMIGFFFLFFFFPWPKEKRIKFYESGVRQRALHRSQAGKKHMMLGVRMTAWTVSEPWPGEGRRIKGRSWKLFSYGILCNSRCKHWFIGTHMTEWSTVGKRGILPSSGGSHSHSATLSTGNFGEHWDMTALACPFPVAPWASLAFTPTISNMRPDKIENMADSFGSTV